MTPEEKTQQKKAWKERNRHVLSMMGKAQGIAEKMITEGHPKQDIILLGELLLDIGRRFD
jgi:hypothetical protein